jgi:N-acetylglucosamine kinase-like BadF-type ATPase
MPRIIVGVDAGGSKTIAALAQDGELLRTREGLAANPSSRGVEAASGTLVETIVSALDGAQPHAIFVGAAGARRADVAESVKQTLESRFPQACVRVRDDACIALRAALPEGDGVVLIAGTGSVAYAERGGEHFHAGGYGYLVGDEGSGFAIGSAAIRQLLRAFDGRVPRDVFLDEVAAYLEVNEALDVLARVYGNPHAVTQIAGLARVVLDAANRGERSANKIVQNAALELSDLVKALIKRAGLTESEAPIVFAGGLLAANTLLSYLLETRLQNDLPRMPILKGAVEPYRGALILAEKLVQ